MPKKKEESDEESLNESDEETSLLSDTDDKSDNLSFGSSTDEETSLLSDTDDKSELSEDDSDYEESGSETEEDDYEESELSEDDETEESSEEESSEDLEKSISRSITTSELSLYDDLETIDKTIGFWVEGVPYILGKNESRNVLVRIYIVKSNKLFYDKDEKKSLAEGKFLNFIRKQECSTQKHGVGGVNVVFRQLFMIMGEDGYESNKDNIMKMFNYTGPYIYNASTKKPKHFKGKFPTKEDQFFVVDPRSTNTRFALN
jgi:hypothetical protein